VRVDVDKDGGSEFSDGIDGLQLNIEGVESEVEDLKAGDLKQKHQGTFQYAVKRFPQFISTGDLLVDQELREVTHNVLEFDLKRTLLLVKHLPQVHPPLLHEQLLQLLELLLPLDLIDLEGELQLFDADLLWLLLFRHC
jgi:hypothetical protein